MSVLHVNIPSFPIEVERLADPRLRRRPVAITASSSPRAPLLYVSPEAFAAGIRRGMVQYQARRWECSLICLSPNERLYQRAQQKLLEVVSRFTPVSEPMRLGSVFLDMTGMELLFGRAAAAASKIRSELLRTLHLDPTLGVARNKLVSRVAAKVMRPHGLYQVYEGHEAEFLHPLPVEYLPGVGSITSGKLLRELGIRNIGELAAIPVPLLVQIFGKVGMELHDRACGEDSSFVISNCSEGRVLSRCAPPGTLPWGAPAHRVTRPSKEFLFDMFFSEPTNNDQRLLAALWHLCERAGAALRAAGEVAIHGILEGIYVDGLRIDRKATYAPPAQSDFVLFRPWESGWQKFMERRLQFKSLTLTLQGLQPEYEQLDFTADPRERHLHITLDGLRRRYGEDVVQWGRHLQTWLGCGKGVGRSNESRRQNLAASSSLRHHRHL